MNMTRMQSQEERRDRRKRIYNNQELSLLTSLMRVGEVEAYLHAFLALAVDRMVSFTSQAILLFRNNPGID
jgi:hypothetical protein